MTDLGTILYLLVAFVGIAVALTIVVSVFAVAVFAPFVALVRLFRGTL